MPIGTIEGAKLATALSWDLDYSPLSMPGNIHMLLMLAAMACIFLVVQDDWYLGYTVLCLEMNLYTVSAIGANQSWIIFKAWI